MKALTIREPYASLIAHGFKSYETRGYKTNYRGPVIIHAAKELYDCGPGVMLFAKLALRFHSNAQRFGCSEILAVADLVDCIKITPEFTKTLSNDERMFGFYSDGRYAWKLENVRALKPVKVRGFVGLWDCPVANENEFLNQAPA